ncbi:MAG: DUF4256 domain-containing protein [Bacteroidetes bacterium]|nr:MAG: DUF4256 domain-containing protein [Bacteroidota bacterium]REK05679.1 MAG: DUF4256 domain-containing protein [Bacteroidota bacterium]REK32015.1 MAG: DUF4256 domain-containing protein [Bacteroidota bacterium]REK50079.1 MAG: DUF4256 domain-containing protein [Bacteroidota bacterium]
MKKNKNNLLTNEKTDSLLSILAVRFEKNMNRHKGMEWHVIEKKLVSNPAKLWSLNEMEITGGEPDVCGFDKKSGEHILIDCSEESPKGRRSICYDPEAHASRKEHRPKHSALGMAAEMGIEILDEAQYRALQKLGTFDAKTSSWILTPADIRQKGGALFCDFRFGHVFVYHNGAESYYAARGFRGMLRV